MSDLVINWGLLGALNFFMFIYWAGSKSNFEEHGNHAHSSIYWQNANDSWRLAKGLAFAMILIDVFFLYVQFWGLK